MALREIVLYPNKVLTTPAEPVEEVNDEIRTLVKDMVETMYHENGIGLAAPQVGVSKRVAVVDVARNDEEPDVRVLINPEILETSQELVRWEEGCLSFPDLFDEVVRPKTCKIRALNIDGEPVVHEADGLLAICMQHEIDHLDGIVFVDHLSRLKRRMALKRFKKVLQKLEEDNRQPAQYVG